MAPAAPGGVPLRTMLAVYTALCVVRPLQFAAAIWTMHGVTAESFVYLGEFIASMFCCGLPGLALVAWADRRTLGQPLRARVPKHFAALVVGALVFGLCMTGIGYLSGREELELPVAAYIAMFSTWMLTAGGLLVAILLLVHEEASTAARAHDASLAAAQSQRMWDEIRLRFLRSQIEPHFLFNALANVKRLYETDARGGRGMLRALADYLELALSADRMSRRTVDDEVALTRAYLDIFAVRMGERLRVQLDVPEDLRGAPMPPLMLGTLVENALKHGIGPRAGGGCIRVDIRRDGEDLVARVADDGVGFRDASGSGVGLSNTRARLATLFGERGRLDVARNPGGGVVATLRLPLEAAS